MSFMVEKTATIPTPHRRTNIIFWSSLWTVCALIIFSRRPDAILHAQFWSEDGRIWFADAYNVGAFKALLIPHTGYLQTIPRLTAAASLLLPLSLAPLFFNLVAIVFQITPVVLLNSSRFDRLVPSMRGRLIVSFFYLAIPNVWEVDANITNAQWHAALLMFMIVIVGRPATLSWKIFDVSVLILGGLTGPFVLILLPIAIINWRVMKESNAKRSVLILVSPFLIQLFVILTSAGDARFQGQLGMNIQNLISIVSGQVVLSSTIGIKGYFLMHYFWWSHLYVPVVVFIIGSSLMVAALFTAPIELKLFIIYSWGLLAAALVSPAPGTGGESGMSAWQSMATPNTNLRYFFFPTLAWLVSLIWLLRSRLKRFVKTTVRIFLVCTVAIAIPTSWGDPNFRDMHYQRYVAEFNQVPVGTVFNFPQNPPEWVAPMTLIKK